jgi:3-hydroxyacyl-CoA dehydrogenase
MKPIQKVAVLGAGTMGSRIAAHLANAGVATVLLDIVAPDSKPSTRSQIAAAGLEGAQKSKPAAFFEASLAHLVATGNFEDDLAKVADADWIVEAVVENLDLKRALLRKVDAHRRPGTIITTNTSGLAVAKIAEGFPDDFRCNWFGTHFFNPPRYMRLLEIIPTPESDEAAIAKIAQFCDVHLGKGIVRAKDTPNFIGNRIGIFSMLNVMRLMQAMDFTIEEIDALTGPAVGWPKSATFRLTDMVGLDIVGHVVANMAQNVHDERSDLELPHFCQQMLERKWLGDKTKGGFYKKSKGGDSGEDARQAIDWKTLAYHPQDKPRFPVLDMAKNVEDTGARVKMLLGLDGSGNKPDKAGLFLWSALSELWTYAANRIPEISDTVVEIDRAMRMGFNWELGPFELWDAAGVQAAVARMKAEGLPVAANAENLLACGKTSWYSDDASAASGKAYFDLSSGAQKPVAAAPGVWSAAVAKKSRGIVKKNSGASLIDLGDGVACLEFHSKMNSLGGDILSLITQTLKPGGLGDNFDAFVITNDAANFSVGANLMLLLLSIQEGEWDEVDLAIRQFQGMTQAIKFSPKPVVSAPFGLTLGGGCELSLHAAARQPHAELYMGLVEIGVGLLPGGGGCKEMLLRAVDSAAAIRPTGSKNESRETVELVEAMKKTFETIATAKVATSAAEARSLGFLHHSDAITMNRDRVLADAKARAQELVRVGYQAPVPRTDIPAPGENMLATLKMGLYLMRQGDFITEHEAKLGTKIAEVLCGSNVTPGSPISEQYLLDLEREAFKSLCGEKKTQERIQFTLKTGKTLRN